MDQCPKCFVHLPCLKHPEYTAKEIDYVVMTEEQIRYRIAELEKPGVSPHGSINEAELKSMYFLLGDE